MKIEKYLKNLINGELVDPRCNEYIDVVNPATGDVFCHIPASTEEDVDLAVEAAMEAFPAWSASSAEKRGKILDRMSDLIQQNLPLFAEAETTDNGKPIYNALNIDIPRAVSNFRFFSSAVQHFSSEAHQMTNKAINYTLRQPVGVVGCISPWNLPLYLFTWKIAPALASGNCVVAKPSEVTPVTAYLLSKVAIEAGLPPGVLNVLHGEGVSVGNAMVGHPHIKAISFTGGTETGRKIAATAAPMFKKLSLELGGKNPNIIFADCDFDKMIETTIRSSFSNQGQICLCGSRIFIERPIYEKFKAAFIEKAKFLHVGDPISKHTQIGAVVSEQHRDKILSYIELAKQEGGNILLGGNAPTNLPKRCANGFFIEPTIIDGLASNCRVNQEEIFGPVVSIMPFDTEEEVIEMANNTNYGLAATVWTENINRANRMALKLDVGVVWINTWLLRDLRTPFGGMKDSGMGREGGQEVLRFFTEPKNVCIKIH